MSHLHGGHEASLTNLQLQQRALNLLRLQAQDEREHVPLPAVVHGQGHRHGADDQADTRHHVGGDGYDCLFHDLFVLY